MLRISDPREGVRKEGKGREKKRRLAGGREKRKSAIDPLENLFGENNLKGPQMTRGKDETGLPRSSEWQSTRGRFWKSIGSHHQEQKKKRRGEERDGGRRAGE